MHYALHFSSPSVRLFCVQAEHKALQEFEFGTEVNLRCCFDAKRSNANDASQNLGTNCFIYIVEKRTTVQTLNLIKIQPIQNVSDVENFW